MSQVAPREWLPHERPLFPGSPSTPLPPHRARWAFALVGALVAITGSLGNAMVTTNLPELQGSLGVTAAEIAWLPAAYVMTNVSANLVLIKFRQQFGLRLFTEISLVLYRAGDVRAPVRARAWSRRSRCVPRTASSARR